MFKPHHVKYFYVKSVVMKGDPPRLESLLLFQTSENLMNYLPTQSITRDQFVDQTISGDVFMTRLRNGDLRNIEMIEDPAGDHFVTKGKPQIPVLFNWNTNKT